MINDQLNFQSPLRSQRTLNTLKLETYDNFENSYNSCCRFGG